MQPVYPRTVDLRLDSCMHAYAVNNNFMVGVVNVNVGVVASG